MEKLRPISDKLNLIISVAILLITSATLLIVNQINTAPTPDVDVSDQCVDGQVPCFAGCAAANGCYTYQQLAQYGGGCNAVYDSICGGAPGGCADNGAFPAPGQPCCSPYTQQANGRCGLGGAPACLNNFSECSDNGSCCSGFCAGDGRCRDSQGQAPAPAPTPAPTPQPTPAPLPGQPPVIDEDPDLPQSPIPAAADEPFLCKQGPGTSQGCYNQPDEHPVDLGENGTCICKRYNSHLNTNACACVPSAGAIGSETPDVTPIELRGGKDQRCNTDGSCNTENLSCEFQTRGQWTGNRVCVEKSGVQNPTTGVTTYTEIEEGGECGSNRRCRNGLICTNNSNVTDVVKFTCKNPKSTIDRTGLLSRGDSGAEALSPTIAEAKIVDAMIALIRNIISPEPNPTNPIKQDELDNIYKYLVEEESGQILKSIVSENFADNLFYAKIIPVTDSESEGNSDRETPELFSLQENCTDSGQYVCRGGKIHQCTQGVLETTTTDLVPIIVQRLDGSGSEEMSCTVGVDDENIITSVSQNISAQCDENTFLLNQRNSFRCGNNGVIEVCSRLISEYVYSETSQTVGGLNFSNYGFASDYETMGEFVSFSEPQDLFGVGSVRLISRIEYTNTDLVGKRCVVL